MATPGHEFFEADNGIWLTDMVPPPIIAFPDWPGAAIDKCSVFVLDMRLAIAYLSSVNATAMPAAGVSGIR